MSTKSSKSSKSSKASFDSADDYVAAETDRYPELNAPQFEKTDEQRSGGHATNPVVDPPEPTFERQAPIFKKTERERSGGAHLQMDHREDPQIPEDSEPPVHDDPRLPSSLQKTVPDDFR